MERPPLAGQERENELALPLALDELVLDEVRFLPHPQPLEHTGRCRVPSLEAADHAMQVELLEGEPQKEARRLGCEAATVVVRMEDESDLALPVQAAQVEEGAGADQLRSRFEHDCEAEVLALGA